MASRWLQASGWLVALGVAVAVPGASLAGAPAGGQFQINTLGGNPSIPDLAIDADGDFVVVWQAELENDKLTSGGDTSIHGRRFDAAGTAQSDQFAVNDIVTHEQSGPRVGMAADGSFVVIWTDEFEDVFPVQKIYLRRFDTSGSPIAPRQLARVPFVFVTQKDIAVDASGDFVLSWGELAGGCTGFCMPVYAQTYDSSAVAQSGVIEVEPEESTPASFLIYVAVAIDSDGDFIVVWTPPMAFGPDTVLGQRYDASGSPAGGQFQINTTSTSLGDVSVAMADDGAFVVAWSASASTGADNDGTSIQAQRYNASGVAQGGEFQVNTVTAGDQDETSIALASNGDFVITWKSDSSVGTDTSGTSIQARRYLASGSAVGEQFQANSLLSQEESTPRVVVEPSGDFVIAWTSKGGAADNFAWTIEGQRYVPAAVESPEATCDDLFDNDSDGDADCADLQCDGMSGCTFGVELTCNDSIDNDGDGFADCADSECNAVGSCESAAEVSCGDAFDNDGDSRIDCRDSDCVGTGACEGIYELSCFDMSDNDSDGDVDCHDLDCAAACSLLPPGVPTSSPYATLFLIASLAASAFWWRSRRVRKSASA